MKVPWDTQLHTKSTLKTGYLSPLNAVTGSNSWGFEPGLSLLQTLKLAAKPYPNRQLILNRTY